MREAILVRMQEIRETFGSDRFIKPNRKGHLRHPSYWPLDMDFSKLDDEELLKAFEKLVKYSYRQR